MLLFLLFGQRHQSLHLFDVHNMSLTRLPVTFGIGGHLVTSRPGLPWPEVLFPAYPMDNIFWVPTTECNFLKCFHCTWRVYFRILLMTWSPVSVASRDIIRRWAGAMM